MSSNEQEIQCCPKFEPEPWNDRIFEWSDKKFIKDKVFTFLYIPINFGQVMVRVMKKVETAKAQSPDNICLSEHTSKWNMNIYLAVDKEIPNAENITISGKFLSKVYEGDFKETGKWCKDFEAITKEKGFSIKKQYVWYTTCPKCAKVYGKNYVVIVGSLE
jgi:hypothetical protein